MREITKRLEKMSNQFGYEQREEERIAIVKEHLMDSLEDINLSRRLYFNLGRTYI